MKRKGFNCMFWINMDCLMKRVYREEKTMFELEEKHDRRDSDMSSFRVH